MVDKVAWAGGEARGKRVAGEANLIDTNARL